MGFLLQFFDVHNFNSQPREGGWRKCRLSVLRHPISTHSRAKAAGRHQGLARHNKLISTHSRAKAAGNNHGRGQHGYSISTHSRAKAAGLKDSPWVRFELISTHSRAKAAGQLLFYRRFGFVHFNSQPREGGWHQFGFIHGHAIVFQLTAARRRLGSTAQICAESSKFQLTAARRRLVLTASMRFAFC